MDSDQNKILIDLGCGLDPAPGYIGLDIRKTSKAKILAILSDLPFKKNCIDGFRARHVMEHFASEDIFAILRQAAYSLKAGGEFQIIVPHYSGQIAYHLDHKSFWSLNSPHTLAINGQHDEWIGSHYELGDCWLFWMRREYKGRFPLLVKIMNYLINKSPFIMERLSAWYGGIYEMSFVLEKVK